MIFKILFPIAISIVGTLVVALILVMSQSPVALENDAKGLDFTAQLSATNQTPADLASLEMSDGYDLNFRHYPSQSKDAPLLVMVHGSGWHGLQFDTLAASLSDQAEVLVPDLRGHGSNPGRRGDVDYIGQFEDDLAELIQAHAKPGQKIILGGHSSGGGLVVRFAGGKHGDILDGAVLLAPFLKHNAPTTRANSGGWATALTRRIIGLSILNTFRIRALNHLTIIQFNMPSVVLDGPLGDTATTEYSYRLNTSFAPRGDYLSDVVALPSFLLVAGVEDEAFFAEKYEETMSPVTSQGRYVLVPEMGHLDIVSAPQTLDVMRQFLKGFAS